MDDQQRRRGGREKTSEVDRAAEARRERKARNAGVLNGSRQHLFVPLEIQEDAKRRGMVLRWVRQDPMRIAQTQGVEWEFVTDEKGQNIVKAAGRERDDGKLVLMQKRADWHAEDRAERVAINKKQLLSEEDAQSDPTGLQSGASVDGLANYDRGSKLSQWVPEAPKG